MLIRRLDPLFVERIETPEFDLAQLLSGHSAYATHARWRVLRTDRDAMEELDDAELTALSSLSGEIWVEAEEVATRIGSACLQDFIVRGLVQCWPRDAHLRTGLDAWHPLSALAHRHARWSEVDASAPGEAEAPRSIADLVERHGAPPSEYHLRTDAVGRELLSPPNSGSLESLCRTRVTCRNFDSAMSLPKTTLADTLHAVFGVQGRVEVAPGAFALKKNSPSGGGLHPLEAYVLVQWVEDLSPGLYHYNIEAHALDRLPDGPDALGPEFALRAVAGQQWFANAPVLVILSARFARSQWKYRNHPKLYRAILLEAGHLSQNLYLAATERGLGAFITAAINECVIEQALGVDPMVEGVLAICGFGQRAASKNTVELDPAGTVWAHPDGSATSVGAESADSTGARGD